MQHTVEEVLAIGERLLASRAREQVLTQAYHRNKLEQTLEALQKARALSDQLMMEYLDATDANRNTPA